MKRFALLFFFCIGCTTLLANDTFSKTRLDPFFDDFTCEEKNKLGDAGLTDRCTAAPPNGGGGGNGPFFPPPDPPPPPFPGGGLLPVVIVNNSGHHDEDVYIVVTGKDTGTSVQSFLDITTGTGIGTVSAMVAGQNASSFSKKLTELRQGSTGWVFYTPEIDSGVIWFSFEKKLDMPVNPGPALVQPNFLSPSDPNYFTNFDIYEYTYDTSSVLSTDATAVTFHSIPLYGYISTPAAGSFNHTGLFQPRSFIMSQVANTFASHPTAAEWMKLFLKSGNTILRVVSTGKSMSVPTFDPNYFNNPAAYNGYSYEDDVWTGASSYYTTNTLTIIAEGASGETYTGNVQPAPNNDTIKLTSSPSNYEVIFKTVGPTVTPPAVQPTFSQNIFGGNTIVLSDTSPGMADGIKMSIIFEQAIIAGLVPTTQTLSASAFPPLQNKYYQVNSSLTALGQANGPWYDVYSQALHKLGSIYTFGFDESLWPQVLLTATPFVAGQTYLGIMIGNVTD